jgi:hypothetical protein
MISLGKLRRRCVTGDEIRADRKVYNEIIKHQHFRHDSARANLLSKSCWVCEMRSTLATANNFLLGVASTAVAKHEVWKLGRDRMQLSEIYYRSCISQVQRTSGNSHWNRDWRHTILFMAAVDGMTVSLRPCRKRNTVSIPDFSARCTLKPSFTIFRTLNSWVTAHNGLNRCTNAYVVLLR